MGNSLKVMLVDDEAERIKSLVTIFFTDVE